MYNHKNFEKKLIKKWEKNKIYKTKKDNKLKKHYVLVMFPYPSGAGLHIGHARVFGMTDIYARMKRMQGFNVLHPIGYDAFGLPAEEFAIKNKMNPKITTKKNNNIIKNQLKNFGVSYDWDRELSTTDPEFYKWTQWIFLKLYEKGLAFEEEGPINWCPSCKTGLANEDLEGGNCERCGTPVKKKYLKQWFLRITDYAEKLLQDIDTLEEWPEHIKKIQKDWIGKSEGYEIPFKLNGINKTLTIFTTRPDTLYGCSFLAISPNSKFLYKILNQLQNKKEIQEYIDLNSGKKPEEEGDKTGVLIKNITVTHPITGKNIPIYVADYVLGEYGTGAIFGSPAHDDRDFEFAKKYGLDITRVIEGDKNLPDTESVGKLINSDKFNGLSIEEAKEKITKAAGGKKSIQYKLQDWLFSRQRYWGEPIPIIHCEKCGTIPLTEDQLPLELPDVEFYEPTGTKKSPLDSIDSFVNVKCHKCKGKAKRETNTMPQWAGSSWYYLRYIDNKNNEKIFSSELEKKWMPVDIYSGGTEHAARHLIYARFWHKFLYDIGVVSTKEPFTKLRAVGLVKSKDGSKMSKRSGDAINPEEAAEFVGADALRLNIAFLAPFNQSVSWSKNSITGPRKFLDRIYNTKDKLEDRKPDSDLEKILHQTINSVIKDIESFKFNTVVSSIMILYNAMLKESEKHNGTFSKQVYEDLLKLLAPLAPFITDYIWNEVNRSILDKILGVYKSIHLEKFPMADERLVKKDMVKIVVQINGKMRGNIDVPADSNESYVVKELENNDVFDKYNLKEKKLKIFIPNKILSYVDK